MVELAPVKPDLLKWARSRGNLALSDLEERFPRYQEWEAGSRKPTIRQLEQFAELTHTPLGFLLLAQPPAESLPVPDFRTVRDQEIGGPSPDLLDTIHEMQRRQSWVRDYLVELGADPITFVGAAELTDPISKTVDSIRGALRLDRRWAQPIKSYEDALNLLLERAEDAGLLMMTSGIVGNNTRRVLDVSEFRGFVLIDEYAPLIFTNNRDAKSAQIFTLVHEIAHVWLGSSGLFDLERTISPDMDIERHCNRVAVELLLPRDQFNEAWKQSRAQDKFREISRRFRVSRVVVARRALDSKKITKEEFFSLYEELRNEDKPVKTENDGGNFYNTAHRRLGNRFSRLVSQGVREGRLAYRDAYRLTGLRGKTFDNYMARFGA